MISRSRHLADDEWSAATLRSGEPWTPAEEERLRRIYRARRKVVWMGRPRTKPMYAAAKALKRTPCACAGRMAMLVRIDKSVNVRMRGTVQVQMAQATEIEGIETTNDWRFFRLEKGGPLSVKRAIDVIVSVFGGTPPRVPAEVRIFERGADGRIKDCDEWLFEEKGHTDHEACLRAAGYEPKPSC